MTRTILLWVAATPFLVSAAFLVLVVGVTAAERLRRHLADRTFDRHVDQALTVAAPTWTWTDADDHAAEQAWLREVQL